MPHIVKALGFIVTLALAIVAGAQGGFAADPGTNAALTKVQDTPSAEMSERARNLIEALLRQSRVTEIYGDLRRTLRDVYIPVVREATEGGYPGIRAPDAAGAATMAKGLTLLNYANRVGDELEAALAEGREAMISDAANLIATQATPSELEDMRQVLAQPATQKAFDVLYAASLLVTSFTYEETRTFAEYQALIESWVGNLTVDPSQLFPGLPGGSQMPPPSPRKIEKAQALFSDVVQITRVEEMVTDAKRFARDVYTELAPKSPGERQALRDQIDQAEFAYTMQKAVVLAAGPPILAATLTDEQIATLHTFVRTPAFAKLFTLLHDVVRRSASFSADEIQSTQSLLNDIERKATDRSRSPDQEKRIEDDWNAFVEKWSGVLLNRISPETREGLISSYQSLQGDFRD